MDRPLSAIIDACILYFAPIRDLVVPVAGLIAPSPLDERHRLDSDGLEVYRRRGSRVR